MLLLAAPVAAQDDSRAGETNVEIDEAGVPEASSDIEEMVVLGGGRDDFLKDMSISVKSFSAAEIKSLRIQNIADLAEYTPNLEINTRSAASNPTLFIRGIGLKDYNANAAGAVAIYQDGININSPAIQLGQLFDTEEIAVLRGPQGSVNGRNATAGAIMINSVLPDGEFDASGSFSYGNYQNIQGEGALAFPLVDELLSTRFAFTANFRDGTVRNRCADWKPEKVGKPALTEKSIRKAFKYNKSLPGFRKLKGSPPKFPNQGALSNRESDAQGRPLIPDNVCIWNDPGFLQFEPGDNTGDGPSTWISSGAETPANFEGLKHKVNNVDNWAARMIFRLTPDVGDGMDWVFNGHGGQNLGDSARLQSLRTDFELNGADPYFVQNVNGPSEYGAARNSGFEGVRIVKGLSPPGTTADNIVPGGQAGSNPNNGFYDLDGKEKLDTWGVSVRGLYDTGSVNLTSLSGFEWYERKIDDEGDAIPIAAFPAQYKDDAWQLTQELRAQGEGDRYRWSVGAFILHEELDSQNLFPGLRQRRIEQKFGQTLTSSAAYGNGRYWLLDEVYFDGGIRYNRERKRFSLESTITSLGDGTFNAIPKDKTARTWKGVTGEAVLAWEPGGDWMYDARLDSLNVYLKYSRGMKGGHFNAGLTIQSNVAQVQRIDAVDPEFLHSVEAGFKSRWLQNRLVLNFAIFRYWYEDLQVFNYTNEAGEIPIQGLLNSDANVLGAEIEIQVRPIPGALIQFGLGWLDTEFVNFVVDKAVLGPRGGGSPTTQFDYSGNPLISAPEWNFSGVIEYQIPLSSWGSLVPQYDFSYRTKVYLDSQKLDPISQDPYWLHNVRLAYRTPDGRFEIAGWVENFLDKRYKIDVFDLSLDNNTVLESWNDPRMYGLTLSAYF
jgi:iron complex outermembrane receptor protein